MKKKFLSVLVAFMAVIGLVCTASADTGYTATFSTSITFQNVGSGTANIAIAYQQENNASSAATYNTTLAAGASSSIFSGSVSGLPAGFQGSAVLSADQPVVATMVQ